MSWRCAWTNTIMMLSAIIPALRAATAALLRCLMTDGCRGAVRASACPASCTATDRFLHMFGMPVSSTMWSAMSASSSLCRPCASWSAMARRIAYAVDPRKSMCRASATSAVRVPTGAAWIAG